MSIQKKSEVLPLSFYRRPVLEVAPELLGCSLCVAVDTTDATPSGPEQQEEASGRQGAPTILRKRITEVEAYDGIDDKACHASNGKTARNAIMFETGGRWYVYLCYGVHWMLNIVTGEPDYPAAVLIRGAGELVGPGRLTKGMGINKRFNTLEALPEKGLWIEAGSVPLKAGEIVRTPRIGVAYAGEVWSQKPYRYLWRNEHPQAVSRTKRK